MATPIYAQARRRSAAPVFRNVTRRRLMQGGRLPVRARLGVLAGGAVALALSSSACGGRSFENGVKDHLRNAEPDATHIPSQVRRPDLGQRSGMTPERPNANGGFVAAP